MSVAQSRCQWFYVMLTKRDISVIPSQVLLNVSKVYQSKLYVIPLNRKNDLILIMTPEKQDKTLELSKHWSVQHRQEMM